MAKKTLNVTTLKAEAVKPLYAVAGATEVAYELARGYAGEAQKTAQERLADVQSLVSKAPRDAKALQDQAGTIQDQAVTAVNARVDEITKDAKDAQSKFEARIAELQKDAKAFPAKVQAQIDEAVAELTKAYDDLADRGEKLVAAIRKDGVRAATAGVKAAEVVKDAPKKSSVARRQAAKKGAAKKAPASNAAAAKSPGVKSKPAAKKAVKQGGAKGGATTAKKTATAKKPRPRRPRPRRPPPRRPPPRRPAPRPAPRRRPEQTLVADGRRAARPLVIPPFARGREPAGPRISIRGPTAMSRAPPDALHAPRGSPWLD